MQKKLNLAYDVINAFVQWFLYHKLPIDEDISMKLDKFNEVKDEN
jgi:hypothetical protein